MEPVGFGAHTSPKRRYHITPLDWLLPCGGETVLPDCEIFFFQEMPEYELCEILRFFKMLAHLKKKKKQHTKHADKTEHVCRLGLAVGPPVCNLR